MLTKGNVYGSNPEQIAESGQSEFEPAAANSFCRGSHGVERGFFAPKAG